MKMEKLSMCRICLAQNVRMYVVVNKDLQELYETLTDVPFVTEDRRPMLACFFCCTKMKQCEEFQRKCLRAEELFSKMLNEDWATNSSINHGLSEFYGGFIKTSMAQISIDGTCQMEHKAIKVELQDNNIKPAEKIVDNVIVKEEPQAFDDMQADYITPKEEILDIDIVKEQVQAFDYIQDDITEPAVEFLHDGGVTVTVPKLQEDTTTDEEMKNEPSDSIQNTCRKLEWKHLTYTNENDVLGQHSEPEDVLPHFSGTDLVDNVPSSLSIEAKRPPVVMMPILYVQGTKLEDTVAEKQKNEIWEHKIIRNSENPMLPFTKVKKTLKKCFKNQTVFICDICQRSFRRSHDLKSHIRSHTGEKPFKCEICERSFRDKRNLTKHFLRHTGNKPHKCDICQRCFIDPTGLKRHIRVHTGEKPHKCESCSLSFTDTNSLKRHTRTHTKEKPYKCDICQRCFSERGNLSKHITRFHSGDRTTSQV